MKPDRSTRVVRGVGRRARAAAWAALGTSPTVRRPFYLGWTRYSASFPREGGLALAINHRYTDPDVYRAQLWSPERMEPRSRMFLTLSVPLLQALREQHDYRHVVTYSPEMPEPWLSQLHEAAERYDVLDPRPVSAGGPLEALQDHLAASDRDSGPAVWFRLDDDDLLATDFLDLLEEHVKHVGPGWAISLGMGYEGLWHEGEVHHVRRKHRPNASHGQAFTGWWDAQTLELTVPGPGNHRTVDHRSPTVLDSRAVAWLRLIHAWQDTQGDRPSFDTLAAPLLRNPSRVRSEADLLERWPTLEGAYRPDPA